MSTDHIMLARRLVSSGLQIAELESLFGIQRPLVAMPHWLAMRVETGGWVLDPTAPAALAALKTWVEKQHGVWLADVLDAAVAWHALQPNGGAAWKLVGVAYSS